MDESVPLSTASDGIKPKPSELMLASLQWLLATSLGWIAYLVVNLILAAFSLGSTLVLLIPLSPLVALAIGYYQGRILKRLHLEVAEGWARRTVLGWIAGFVTFYFVEELLNRFYHFQPNFPELSHFGLLYTHGSQIEVASLVIGWTSVGAVLGAFQWRMRKGFVLTGLWWMIANAVAWGAASLLSWAIFKSYPQFGYESVCIDCVVRFFQYAAGAGIVIALVTAVALWSKPLAVCLGLIISCASVLQVTQATQQSAQSIFDPPEMYPARELHSIDFASGSETVLIGFSDDGKLVAATKIGWSQGDTRARITVLWRTSDWKQLGRLERDGEQINVDYDGMKAVVSASEFGDTLYVRRADNNAALTTLYLGSLSPDPTGRFMLSSPEELRRVSDGALVAYLKIPPRYGYASPNPLVYAWSPDGSMIAAGSENGRVWLWEVP